MGPTNTFVAFADVGGSVQTLNSGTTDDGSPIYFELETQEIDFGDRMHMKGISDEIVVFTAGGLGSLLEVRADEGDYQQIPLELTQPITIGDSINAQGHYFTFKWSGSTTTTSPVFEGLYIEEIQDLGMRYA